jgi:putative transposase
MRWVKGRTSAKIFEEYPALKKRYWGRHFWARGYFCVTAGELTKEMIEEYLSHHFERDPHDGFDIELWLYTENESSFTRVGGLNNLKKV